ncbi:MAG: hypothetical protein HY791_06410 [Deltaproteobacteria bacterium]|nr:hypothetical protein [Deltaproteobacteria bacterium]
MARPQFDSGFEERLTQLERLALPSVRLLHRAQAALEVREILAILHPAETSIRDRANGLLQRLRQVDEFQLGPVRAALTRGAPSPEMLDKCLSELARPDIDAFLEKVLEIERGDGMPQELGPNLVPYHPSPAWAALAVARRLRPEDTLFELGCGLGKVTLIAGLWSRASVVGIEIEERLAARARARAAALAPRVTIRVEDARESDLSTGTDFYLYTPFLGDVLTEVLYHLEAVAWTHPIRVWTLGRVTEEVGLVGWLEPDLEIQTLVRYRSNLIEGRE